MCLYRHFERSIHVPAVHLECRQSFGGICELRQCIVVLYKSTVESESSVQEWAQESGESGGPMVGLRRLCQESDTRATHLLLARCGNVTRHQRVETPLR